MNGRHRSSGTEQSGKMAAQKNVSSFLQASSPGWYVGYAMHRLKYAEAGKFYANVNIPSTFVIQMCKNTDSSTVFL